MEQDVFTQQNCELCILPMSQRLAIKVLLTTGNTLMKHFKHLEKYNSKTFSSNLDHAILTEAFINLT